MKRRNPATTGACAMKLVLPNAGILAPQALHPQAFSVIQPFGPCRTIGDRLRLAVRQRRLTDALEILEGLGLSGCSAVFFLQSVGV